MVTGPVSQIHIVETCCKEFNTSDWLRYLSSSSGFSYLKSDHDYISEHRPLTKSFQSPPAGARKDLSTEWYGLHLSSSCYTVSLSVYLPVGSNEELVGQCSNLVFWVCGQLMSIFCSLCFVSQVVSLWFLKGVSQRCFPVVSHRLVLLILTGQYIPRILRRHLLI